MRQLFTVILLIVVCEYSHSQCIPSAQNVLDVNDVTAPIDNDGSIGYHQTPFTPYAIDTGNGSASAGLAHGVWVGGLNQSNELRLAAMRYGQVGNDFFPGPLSVSNAQTDSVICAEYDRIWKVDRWKVDEFIARWGEPGYVIPWEILNWPANSNINQNPSFNLAPYFDADGSGNYNPSDGGDYPFFNPNDGTTCNSTQQLLDGDQALWWVINDNAGPHTETGGLPVGLEIRCIAYAFDECGPLATTTFYKYELINVGSQTLNNTYVGIWADVDLGFAEDDFVQCDVGRNLGFSYDTYSTNGSKTAFGLDLLSGPFSNNDGVDNDNDGIVDNEKLPMTKFLSHHNSGSSFSSEQADPSTAANYYGYLKGVWLDGEAMCYGGNGHPATGCNGVASDFMFPGNSDPSGIGTGGVPQQPWTNQAAPQPLDRRFLISSGPFTLEPGAVHRIEYAAIWANDPTGVDPIQALLAADDIIQAGYDSCFSNISCCPPSAEINVSQPSVNQFFFASIDEGDEYLWDFGDGATSTERFPPAHVYSDNQVYEVTLIVYNECGSDTTSIEVSTQFFNVDEIERDNILIYPNPATTNLTIESRTPLAQVWVRDVAGRAVLPTLRLRSGYGNVDVSSLPSGIYLVEALTQSGQRSVQKVVVE
jgi:hypothetical protein